MRLFLKQNGFSLLEVMIAGSLLAGLAYFGTKLMSDQVKGQKTVESRSEITSILADIRTVLSKEQSCKATFEGRPTDIPEGTITSIKQQEYFPITVPPTPPTPILDRYISNTDPQLGTPYGNGNVKILGYELDDANDTEDAGIGLAQFQPLPAPSPNRSGMVNLKVRFFIGHHKAQGTAELVRKVKINVEVKPDGTIERCTSIGSFGTDGRYLHRISDDANYRTMQGDLIIAETFEIEFLSDRSLKYDISSLSKIGPKLRKLRPVSYKWKANQEQVNGLIAQEVRNVFPELVGKTNEKLTVDYIQLTPLLLRGFQEVDLENQELKKLVNEMKTEQELLMQELCSRDSTLSFCKR